MPDVTQADVVKAQDAYEKAGPKTRAQRAEEFEELRRRWREQEIAAGRRPAESGEA